MPTYEYSCEKCGRFEEFAQISAPKREVCPTCETRVERVIGAGAGFLFKGSGFYITDYRSSNYQKKANSETKLKELPPTAANKTDYRSSDYQKKATSEAKPKESPPAACSENRHGSKDASPPAATNQKES
ncbi:zinc ribbon domain-containing protein [bacterium]|nr:zinc ribbon domain-containing protein [bacterium]